MWWSIQTPPGCALLFAGDMLERLTNGKIQALRHRVCIDSSPAEASTQVRPQAARQSHIVFVQPDRNSIIQPLQSYRRGDHTDLEPIKYGDWHKRKSSLAFRRE
eukprot:gnl/TRDRNA2_/TRDRNA2_131194_c0_seq1.p1 gnl/TRDRNA2_/TRDRNA2_131194_c0~~gnl/TRDRNA2_/TRDRNA2_131194_c0_seq1.p1  ORF type:complete len:104 (-),score=7.47 gnl/TRDRNA2_/TRDRNA2_131194_c0_seq1:86-397(-)